jgi:hypothetical protein
MKASVCGGAFLMALVLSVLRAPDGHAEKDGARAGATSDKGSAAKPRSGKKPGRAARVNVDVPGLTAKLKSAESGDVKGALDEIRSAGKDAAILAPEVESVLRTGPGVELAQAVLETLGAVGAPSSSAVIRPYARHRKQELRIAAARALIRTGGAEAVAALREALSDSDPAVRNAAAGGLGTLASTESVGDLFAALDHKVLEAAAAIGKLCTVEQCETFAAKIGSFEFDVMTSGFDQILFRPATDVPEEEKIRIVGRIREVGTSDANKYLRDVQSRWPSGGSPQIRRAIDQAVEATGGGARQ